MEYLELTLRFPPESSGSDIYTAYLASIGFEGFLQSGDYLCAYIDVNLLDVSSLKGIMDQYQREFNFEVKEKIIPHINWNESWESSYSPAIINDEVLVKAPFHHLSGDWKYNIIIEPKMSFGTAHHETTSMMMELMLKEQFHQMRVLDMGCGTGILAIFAELLGADDILAIDYDMDSYDNAIENIEKNKCNHIQVKHGTIQNVESPQFNIILANINRNILLEQLKDYGKNLLPGGILLISGFYEKDLPLIKKEAHSCNLSYSTHIEKNNWVAAKMILNS